MVKLSILQAEDLATRALVRANTSEANAKTVAKALVAAESDGLKGHGLSRVPSYGAQSKAGKVAGHAMPSMIRPRLGLVLIDAQHGFAYPAVEVALEALVDGTPGQGIMAAAITRSHHCGVAGHHVERLAEKGLAALMFANTPAAMAPWGGRTGVFGTNPIAFACPVEGRAPLVIDLSLSKIARGNLLAAKQRGEAIPEGWALDAEGRPTTDPAAGLAGTMVPMGDAKGTALALMVEILGAAMLGATLAADASSFLDAKGGPPDTGQLIVAFDVAAFGGARGTSQIARLVDQIEAQEGARLPGARRLALRAQAAAEGLTAPDALVAEIEAI